MLGLRLAGEFAKFARFVAAANIQQLSAMRRLVLALAGVQFLHVSLAHMFRI
jgi:hypothetical protein